MTDYSELKTLADAAPLAGDLEYGSEACHALIEFSEELKRVFGSDVGMASALIAEIDRIADLNHKQFGDAIRKNAEVDQLKAENQALRKDAERYQAVREFWPPKFTRIFEASFRDDQGNNCGDERSGRMDSLIDAAMSKETKG